MKISVHWDCPNFRGAANVALPTYVSASKMGLSPWCRERGQVHVFGRRFSRQTRFSAEKWTSPQPVRLLGDPA